MKNVQLCKQGIGSFIPGKYHEFLLGRFLEGNHLQGLPGIKLPISLFTKLNIFHGYTPCLIHICYHQSNSGMWIL